MPGRIGEILKGLCMLLPSQTTVQQEVGPYTFRQVRRKTAIRWLDGDAAVQWLEYKYHLWEPQLSNGSMQDAITTLNLPLIGGCAVHALCCIQAGGAGQRCDNAGHLHLCSSQQSVATACCVVQAAEATPTCHLLLHRAGALEAIGRLPAGRAAWLLELLLSWVERLGDHRVQGLFTTRTAGELLWGYQ